MIISTELWHWPQYTIAIIYLTNIIYEATGDQISTNKIIGVVVQISLLIILIAGGFFK